MLLHLLLIALPVRDALDMWFWRHDRLQGFSFKSCYINLFQLAHHPVLEIVTILPLKDLWQLSIPSKVNWGIQVEVIVGKTFDS